MVPLVKAEVVTPMTDGSKPGLEPLPASSKSATRTRSPADAQEKFMSRLSRRIRRAFGDQGNGLHATAARAGRAAGTGPANQVSRVKVLTPSSGAARIT